MGKFRSPRVVPRERVRSPKFESRRGKLLRDGCACAARVKLGMSNVRCVHLTDIWSWYRVELRVGDHLGRSEELVSRCVECDLAEPESLASLGGSAPGVVDGILSEILDDQIDQLWLGQCDRAIIGAVNLHSQEIGDHSLIYDSEVLLGQSEGADGFINAASMLLMRMQSST